MAVIYDMVDGLKRMDGLRSGLHSGEAVYYAREIAGRMRRSVIVEDLEKGECYRVTPAGHIWRKPSWWEFAEGESK